MKHKKMKVVSLIIMVSILATMIDSHVFAKGYNALEQKPIETEEDAAKILGIPVEQIIGVDKEHICESDAGIEATATYTDCWGNEEEIPVELELTEVTYQVNNKRLGTSENSDGHVYQLSASTVKNSSNTKDKLYGRIQWADYVGVDNRLLSVYGSYRVGTIYKYEYGVSGNYPRTFKQRFPNYRYFEERESNMYGFQFELHIETKDDGDGKLKLTVKTSAFD